MGILFFSACTASFDVHPVDPVVGDDDDDDDDDSVWGDGHDGDLVVALPDTEVNDCERVATAAAGVVTLTVGTVPAGIRILVWQVQDTVAVIGTAGEITSLGDAGRWEVVRVTAAAGSTLTVQPPLSGTYSTDGDGRRAQACTIPEFRNVTFSGTGSIVARPWDGNTGGFAGFHASGSVTLDGTIRASGAGFIGNPPLSNGGGADETDLVNTPDRAGSIGEGLDASLRNLSGRGNAGNGGGGGGAFNSGGGGGGNGGAGGRGASQVEPETVNPNTCGIGGARVVTVDDRLVFGGAGGSGHQNESIGGGGGNGGGVILVRAFALAGSGAIEADGAGGEDSGLISTTTDGAGGGGAGGTIHIEAGTWSFSGGISAKGGAGGDVPRNGRRGVGGGGGGGRATLPGGAAPPDLGGGLAGRTPDLQSADALAGSTGG